MRTLQLTQAPVAKAKMLIRKPVAEVFEAFVDPEITPIESADYADYTD